MRSNYHVIKGIINSSHSYSEMIHGITAYTQGLLKTNIIKIKNTVVSVLKISTKTEPTVIKIKTDEASPSLKISSKLSENKIIVENKLLNKLYKHLVAENIVIKIKNSAMIYISKVAEGVNKIKVANEAKQDIALPEKVKDNFTFIKNVVYVAIATAFRAEENKVAVENSEVNSSAWYFLKLGNVSGTLADIPNEPIEMLGRKKVI